MKPLIVICYCSVSNNKYITELKSSKVSHSTTKYKREVWQCNKKFENGKKGINVVLLIYLKERLKKHLLKPLTYFVKRRIAF